MSYKNTIAQIKALNWEHMPASELEQVMLLSGYSATEFGESLRIALKLNPGNHALEEMAAGELNTDNLQFGTYARTGDHADFLWHHIKQYGVDTRAPTTVRKAGEDYLTSVRALPDEVRAMSIFSREQELPSVFDRILQAPNWRTPALEAFKYYLERHIAIDSQDGGHADLVRNMPITETVSPFYRARLGMYNAVQSLSK